MKANHTPQETQHPANSLESQEAPTLLVVGTGAVGGFYGAKLAQAGVQVSTVHRSDFDTVSQNGIHIDSIDGDLHFIPHRVLRRVADCQTPPDYLLVTLKALPDLEIAKIIEPVVGPKTVIILLQNGLGVESPVAHAFPENTLISALAFICVQRVAPGRIRHLCFGRITIGCHPEGPSPAVTQLARLFQSAHIPCHVTESPAMARWSKLVWNASFNPISVLAGNATTKEMLDLPESVELIRNIMKEVINIARATGHPLSDGLIEENLQATRQMQPYHTSMALDFMAGRPLETEAILGTAIRIGRKAGIATPCMEGVYALLKLLEKPKKEE
ncbi:MAG: 2-dehydropantoate 2-reductase [Magnetococcales bacterium]|nr:2-dehydropantoate 2-reductase [Magnetococcales bacterium]MBF0438393.1 2-dehydropantoate 2-reductase [Magnetococcales bacterium]